MPNARMAFARTEDRTISTIMPIQLKILIIGESMVCITIFFLCLLSHSIRLAYFLKLTVMGFAHVLFDLRYYYKT